MSDKDGKTNIAVNVLFAVIYIAAATEGNRAVINLDWFFWMGYLAWGIRKNPKDKFMWILHGGLIALLVVLMLM